MEFATFGFFVSPKGGRFILQEGVCESAFLWPGMTPRTHVSMPKALTVESFQCVLPVCRAIANSVAYDSVGHNPHVAQKTQSALGRLRTSLHKTSPSSQAARWASASDPGRAPHRKCGLPWRTVQPYLPRRTHAGFAMELYRLVWGCRYHSYILLILLLLMLTPAWIGTSGFIPTVL